MSRRYILVLLILAAVGSAVMASRGLVEAARRAADNAPSKLESRAAESRTRLEAALGQVARPLESDLVAAARVPELKAALADKVDGPTLLDLFETEDWWAPFRGHDTAILIGGDVVAARGNKHPPAAAGLAPSPDVPGVSAGIVGEARPLIVAATKLPIAGRADATTLMMTAPFDIGPVATAAGLPVALSDGRRVFAGTGGDAEKTALASLVGRESTAVIAESSGLVAVALPAGPGVWMWALAALPAPPPPGWTNPVLWSGLAGLFLLLGVLAWATHQRAAAGHPAAAAPARATPARAPEAPATIEAQIPERLPGTMILGPAGPNAGQDPAMFGRYRLLRRMDGGGMADIYTAVLEGAEGFQRTFVIKRLRPELTRSRSAVEQFIDEAKLGSMLLHPNIVPVFDFGKVGDEYFMAEELVLGRDVARVLQRHVELTGRPLGERAMFYVAHEVLEALTYAHGQVGPDGQPMGIVHRDISPGNIMVTPRGDVKLFDFGIVKATGRVSRTEAGVVKGNVSFMSPEQARGEAVDARSDLFSLGLVIYYGLTNEQIYRGAGTFEQLLQAASGPTAEDLSKLSNLPLTSRILARALAVDPARRYQTAAEFAADLAGHMAGGRAEIGGLVDRLFGDELRSAAAG